MAAPSAWVGGFVGLNNSRGTKSTKVLSLTTLALAERLLDLPHFVSLIACVVLYLKKQVHVFP